MNRICFLLLTLFVGIGLSFAISAHAASNYIVNIGTKGSTTFYFFPSNVTVAVGDSIIWTNTAAQLHDATAGVIDSSPPFVWESGGLPTGQTFTFNFTSAGFYPYRCSRHADSGSMPLHPEQTGAVFVVSANLPPTVGITNPPSNTKFTAPATFALEAAVTNVDDAVVNVQFFKGGVLLGTDISAPYAFTVTNAIAGTNSYTAVALDAGGLLGTSAPVTIIITNPNVAPTVALTNPASGAKFTAPANYTLQTSVTDDVGVVSVQFFNGAVPIGTVGAPPFQLSLSNVAASTNSYSAVATDGGGLKGTSAVVTVTVTNLNLAPGISLTNPANGAAFAAPAGFMLKVGVTDDVGVVSVQYLKDGVPLVTVPVAPFDFAVTNLAAGNYSFTAVATDGGGLSATSSPPVLVQVLTNAVLTNFTRLTNGATQFDVLGIAGQTYIVDAADALTNWVPIGTNVAPAASFPFVDGNAAGFPHRIYRGRQMPVP